MYTIFSFILIGFANTENADGINRPIQQHYPHRPAAWGLWFQPQNGCAYLQIHCYHGAHSINGKQWQWRFICNDASFAGIKREVKIILLEKNFSWHNIIILYRIRFWVLCSPYLHFAVSANLRHTGHLSLLLTPLPCHSHMISSSCWKKSTHYIYFWIKFCILR